MGLADEVAEIEAQPPKGRPSTVRDAVRDALGDEWDEYLVMEADPKRSPAAIWNALQRRKIDVKKSTLTYWCQQARRGSV